MSRLPVFFIGHGSPMNAIEENDFTRSLSGMRNLCPEPKGILCVSAHWMTEGTWVTHMTKPKTIHDFYGFPPELFAVQYPAPGSVELSSLVARTVPDPKIQLDEEIWGLDHGAWSVLRHIFPEAKIPVMQLSLYMAQPPEYHFQLGRKLRHLREQGILIVGSGNIVHNLGKIQQEANAPAYPWATEFDARAKEMLEDRDSRGLLTEFFQTEAGRLSVPTAEHYLPLLYVLGAADEKDELTFTFEGMQNASISMRSFYLG